MSKNKYITDRYTVKTTRALVEIKGGDITEIWGTIDPSKQLSYVVALEKAINGCNISRGKTIASEMNLRSTVEEQNFEIATLRSRLADCIAKTSDYLKRDVLRVASDIRASIDRTFNFAGTISGTADFSYTKESVASVQRALLENK